ncbi:MAG: hypothetical protein ACPKPY_12865 [Nitrososphaeraceae archaeon]
MSNNTHSFTLEETITIENTLFKLRNMIPNNRENKEILDRILNAENMVTSRIDEHKLLQQQQQQESNLRGASIPHIHLPPTSFSVCYNDDRYSGIKNICKIMGLE